jgi:hypothetical protein
LEPGIHANDTIGYEMISSRIHHKGRFVPQYGTSAGHLPDTSLLTSGHVEGAHVSEAPP